MQQTIIYPAEFELFFTKLLLLEGAYVNHPDDPGGITNLGVTRKAWAAYKGLELREVTKADMKALTLRDVKPFYYTEYWLKVRANDLPAGPDAQTADIAVNSGVGRAIRMLQKALNQISGSRLKVDGVIGRKTLTAVESVNPLKLIDELAVTRLWFYFDLATFKVFGKGWGKRAVKVATFATALACGRAEELLKSS